VATHLLDPPRSPAPELGRAVVEHRDAAVVRLAGDVPVEPWVIDQHHGIGPLALEALVGLTEVAKELRQVKQRAANPHDGKLRQVLVQLAPSGRHAWSTKTNALDVAVP